jgi:hypothetical protein
MDENTEEKCLPCEEAKRKGDQLKAELAGSITEPETVRCARCPEAVDWVGNMVKAGKLPAIEAFSLIDLFSGDDTQFDAKQLEIEARTPLGMTKARQDSLKLNLVAPHVGADPQSTVDNDHMNKQRRLVGLPTK